MYKNFIKRCLDLVVAVLLLVLLFIPICIIAVLVFINLGRPILYIQGRPGLNNKIFRIIKFRTMNLIYNNEGVPLPDNQRLTKFGNFLRKSSLDELPELFNVILGDMSLVGPTPLFIKYLPYYSENEKIRHLAKPGLTGLAQVYGRNYLEWDKRLALDVYYVQNISFLLDLKIMLKTIVTVIKGEGIGLNILPDLDDVRNIKIQQN